MHCGDGIQSAEFSPKAQTVFLAPNLAVPVGLSPNRKLLVGLQPPPARFVMGPHERDGDRCSTSKLTNIQSKTGSVSMNAQESAERCNGRKVGTGPFGRFGRHLVQNRNKLGINIYG
jgi:hypothetical protein